MTAVQVSENLPLLASAPGGVQKLRSLVIELAIQGRLVPQDGNAEPGSVLLSAINKARAEFYAESPARPAKVQSNVGDDEQPSPLPKGWCLAMLGWLAHPQAGFAFKSAGFNQDARGLPLVRIRDVGQSFSGTFFEGDYRPEFVVDEGDYLISMDGEFRIAKWCAGKALLNQRVSRLQFFYRALRSDFVTLALQARLRELQGAKAYTTVDHLSGGQIADCVIALPPLEEQHRIVAKVDELMALCDRLEAEQADAEAAHAKLVEALLASLTQARDAADFRASWKQLAGHFHTLFTTEASIDALKQAVLQLALRGLLCEARPADGEAMDLLSETAKKKHDLYQRGQAPKPKQYASLSTGEQPYDLPQGWTWARLGELGLTSTGSTPPTSDSAAFGGAVPFIGPGQISPDGVITLGEKSLTAHGAKQSSIAQPSDLLMVCIGGSIGKCAAADRELAFNQQINCLSVLLASSPFVSIILASADFQNAVLASATGSATPIINRSKWEEIAVPVPPLATQERIVTIVGSLMTLSDQLKRELVTARQHHERLAAVLVEQAVA